MRKRIAAWLRRAADRLGRPVYVVQAVGVNNEAAQRFIAYASAEGVRRGLRRGIA